MPRKTFKQIKAKYWPIVRKYILRRDKYKCQVCHTKNGMRDIDHCFSRSHQAIHFDDRNLTTLCKPCHFKKSKNIEDYHQRVDEAVIKREGKDQWDEIRRLSKTPHTITEEEILSLIEEYEARWPDKGESC